MRITCLAWLLAASPLRAAGSPPPPGVEERQARLERLLQVLDLDLHVSEGSSDFARISVVDLSGDKPVRAGLRDQAPAPAASVIKLALLAHAFELEAQGLLSLAQTISISACNVTGTMSFPPVTDPERLINNKPVMPNEHWRVSDLMQVMVQRSDNPAANTMIDLLDREDTTAFVRSLGAAGTRVARKLKGGASDRLCDDGVGLNAMPPADAATLLSLIAQRELVSPEASEAMLKLLRGQLDRGLIGEAVERRGATYYGKTGATSSSRNDAAFVEGPGRRYVLVVYLHPRPPRPEAVMRRIAQAVDEFFSGRPSFSSYGGPIGVK